MAINFKTNQNGLYADPFSGAIIKGTGSNTDLTFKNVVGDTVVLGPYGDAQRVPGGTNNLNIAGNTAAEIPANNMNSYQGGGAASQEQQQQQIVAQVAQMLQQGATPEQVMQQLVKELKMPPKDAQQLVSAVMQHMQQGAEQQEAQSGQQDQEGAGDQQQDMGMAEMGGSMYDEEQYPQAQDLEWYYKAMGGESFPQAQTYLPYDRPGETRSNFMFAEGGEPNQWGGQSDLDQAYQMMKLGGMDLNAKLKKGGKFTPETFEEYVMRNGGNIPLPKHQWEKSQTGDDSHWYDQIHLNDFGNQVVGSIANTAATAYGTMKGFANNIADRFSMPMGALKTAAQGQPAAQPAQSQPARPAQNTVAPTTGARPATGARPVAARTAATPATTPATPATPATTAAAPATGISFGNLPQFNWKPQAGPWNGYRPQAGGFGNAAAQDVLDANTSTAATTGDANAATGDANAVAGANPNLTNAMGKTAGKLMGAKGAAGLSLLSMMPAMGSFGNLFGSKLKMNTGQPGGGRWDMKAKGTAADEIARTGVIPGGVKAYGGGYDRPRYDYGGGHNTGDFKYSSYDNSGPARAANEFGFQVGLGSAMDDANLNQGYTNLQNQDTISSGVAMGSTASKTPGNAAVGTTNYMGAANPYMSSQPGNFGLDQYKSQYLTQSKTGGSILDHYEDGAEVDLDSLSPEEKQRFINAIYKAGGSVEYI